MIKIEIIFRSKISLRSGSD